MVPTGTVDFANGCIEEFGSEGAALILDVVSACVPHVGIAKEGDFCSESVHVKSVLNYVCAGTVTVNFREFKSYH